MKVGKLRKIIKEAAEYVLLSEDVRYQPNGNGSFDVSIGNSRLDKDNLGGGNADTRVFGSFNDIMYGDGSMRGNSKNLSDTVQSRRAAIVTYTNLINYVKNGRQGKLFTDNNLDPKTKKAIEGWLSSGKSDEDIILDAKRAIDRITYDNAQSEGIYNRAIQAGADGKIARYTTFIVPGTNVKCIALFKMSTFDLSDVIKKGSLRSTSQIMNKIGDGTNRGERIPVTYDGGVTPDIAQNFSLNGIDYNTNTDHFKNVSQYGANGEGKYTSINQFLDKSIIYANYALNKEGFKPTVIVSAPSSSKMNEYYSVNLSRKINVPYIKDFFKKNIINAVFKNNITDEELMERGFSAADVESMKYKIKSYAFNEICYLVETPLREFVNRHQSSFSDISAMKYERTKADISIIMTVLSKTAYKSLTGYLSGSNMLTRHLTSNFMKTKMYNFSEQDKHIWAQVRNRITRDGLTREFDTVLAQMYNYIKQYADKIMNGGYRIRYNTEASKITSIDKRYRPYVEGSFIIADKNLNKNGELFNGLKNGKFLIVDEDVNSGGSFMLCVKALEEKIPEMIDNNIVCLANGFSDSGT